MPIQVPGKRFGKRLEHSKVFGHGHYGRKPMNSDLLITPLVDMFVIIVLFLIANFSATGEILNMSKDIQLPTAANVQEIQLAPVVMVSRDNGEAHIIVDGQSIVQAGLDLTKDDVMNIPALEDRLREVKRNIENMHAMPSTTRIPSRGTSTSRPTRKSSSRSSSA